MSTATHLDVHRELVRLAAHADVVLAAFGQPRCSPGRERIGTDSSSSDVATIFWDSDDAITDPVAWLANTPGGGVLLVGLAPDGRTNRGALDLDLMSHVVDLAIVSVRVRGGRLADGTRLPVLLVPESWAPVPDGSGAFRMWSPDGVRPFVRADWIDARQRQLATHPAVRASDLTMQDVGAGPMSLIRSGESAVAYHLGHVDDLSDRDSLACLGVLLPGDQLTVQGARLLTSAGAQTPALVALARDTAGNPATPVYQPPREATVMEQVCHVMDRLYRLIPTTRVLSHSGATAEEVARVPRPAVLEGVLNAVAHRDWSRPEPVQLVWTADENTVEIGSPGAFPLGVTASTTLNRTVSTDLFWARLLRAVYGLMQNPDEPFTEPGMHRMYRSMIRYGLRPPVLRQEPGIAGPYVRLTLRGGEPLDEISSGYRATPLLAETDVRPALLTYQIVRDGFVTPTTLAPLTQQTHAEAAALISRVADSGRSPIKPYRPGIALPSSWFIPWITRDGERSLAAGRARGLFTWHRPDSAAADALVRRWLAAARSISAGELSDLTGYDLGIVERLLERLTASGLVRREPDDPAGTVRYVAAVSPTNC